MSVICAIKQYLVIGDINKNWKLDLILSAEIDTMKLKTGQVIEWWGRLSKFAG